MIKSRFYHLDMMRKFLSLFIVLLIIPFGVDSTFQNQSNIENFDAKITSISHSPKNPEIGQNITIFVTISSNNQTIDNVTLYFEISDERNYIQMEKTPSDVYSAKIPALYSEGVIEYYASLFISNELVDQSNVYTILILNNSGNRSSFQFNYNQSNTIPSGRYQIRSQDGELELNFTTTHSVNFTIQKFHRNNSFSQKYDLLSPVFNINFNNSNAVTDGRIRLKYTLSNISESNINPHFISILTKEEDGEWNDLDENILGSNTTISVHTSQFSDWTVGLKKPELMLNDNIVSLEGENENQLTFKNSIINYGGYTAKNSTMQIFLPKYLSLVDHQKINQLGDLDPLTSTPIHLSFLPDRVGEYNIIIRLTTENGINSTIELKIQISEPNQFNDIIYNVIYLLGPIAIVSLVTFFFIRRRRSS